jgi:hypothetical protein
LRPSIDDGSKHVSSSSRGSRSAWPVDKLAVDVAECVQ